MARPFLTLNIPDRGLASGTPVVASHNAALMRLFKSFVLEEWRSRVEKATDDVLAEIDRLEFEKLKAVLDLLIPDRNGHDGGTGR